MTARLIRRRLFVLLGVLAVITASTPWQHTAPAAAIDHGKGRPGHCPDSRGVTVVVDFGDLGGQPIVRCYPSASRGTGLDALKGAGFQIAGVQRWGESFICRIENRPSAVEEIPVQGDSRYKEQCVDTPPAAAYWSYWHADNNCDWQYSQWGLKNRDFIPGGYEGWSFSLNATADSNPQPRVPAVRPGTQGQRCGAAPEPAPRSTGLDERRPTPGTTKSAPRPSRRLSAPTAGKPASGNVGGSGRTPGGSRTSTGSGTGRHPGSSGPAATGPTGATAGHGQTAGSATSAPSSSSSATATATGTSVADPSSTDEGEPTSPDPNGVAFTGGEDAPDVNQVLREQSGASSLAPWAAVLVVALLGIAMAVTAHRRRRTDGNG